MNYTVDFSDRKNISISVKGGELKIKAPFGTERSKIEMIIYKHRRWIKLHLERELLKKETEQMLSDSEVIRLKKLAITELSAITQFFAKIMNVHYNGIKISSAKTRFGSCSSKGNISYSYRLMLYPREAREYVVVHELAHIKEMNHSKKFYAIIEKYMPDYKERRKLLKKPLQAWK